MSGTKHFSSRIITTLVLLVLGLAGASYYIKNENHVFPAASIELSVSKQTILKKAKEWAERLAYQCKDNITSIYFSDDSGAKTFLEYEMGTEKANTLMKKEIPIWSWNIRFCRELKDEEFRAELSPDGELVALNHFIPNDVAMPSISKDEAEKLSRYFVENDAKFSLAGFKLIESSTQALAHRSDHSFVWEDASKDYKGAHMRFSASVSGNQISTFNHYLYVPEKWDRKYSTQRTYNNLLSTIAGVFSSVFSTAAVFVFFWALSSGNIRWKFTIGAGLVFAILGLAESFNNFNINLAGYDTTRSYNAFIWQTILHYCLGAFSSFLYGAFLFGPGEALYRLLYPDKPALENLVTAKGLKSKALLLSLVLGYIICGIDLGWVAVYYLGGYRIGFWCPLGVENYQTLSASFPFVSAMYTGLMASSAEEILYRVVGLGLLQKLVGKFWIANFLQALIWGFMHSTYPQQPCYARGVEITLVGMFSGWILRKFGLIPCLVSHYLYDAFCDVRPLMLSGVPGVAWTSAIALMPFAALLFIGTILVKFRGGFADESAVANSSIPILKKDKTEELSDPDHPVYDYKPLSKSWRFSLIGLAICGCICLLFVKPAVIEESPVLKVSKEQALQIARKVLDEQGLSHKGYYEVPDLSTSCAYSSSLQYIFEKVGFAKTAELHKQLYLGYIWSVRFFKPMDPLEYKVIICGDSGKEYGMTISCEEDAKGASLTEAQARKQAEDYLSANHPEYCPFVYESTTQTKRKNRIDYSINFKVPRYLVGEADFKVSVDLIGDKISAFGGDWSIPAKWTFEQSKTTMKDEVVSALKSVSSLAMMLAVLWWFIGVVRAGVIRWRMAIIWAIPLCALGILPIANSLPTFFSAYGTTTPLNNYIGSAVLRDLGALVGAYTGYILLFAVSFGVLRIVKPGFSIPALLKVTFRPSGAQEITVQRQIWLDSIIIAYCLTIIASGNGRIWALLYSLWSPAVRTGGNCGVISSAPDFYNYLLSDISLASAITSPAFPLLLAGLYFKYLRKFIVYFIFAVCAALLYSASDRYWQDFVIESLSMILSMGAYWLIIARVCRTNALAYVIYNLISEPLHDLIPFVRFGGTVFLADTVQIILFLLLPLLYLVYLYSPHRTDTNGKELGKG